MVNETKGLEALNPLTRFSVLSLFPRSFGVLQEAPRPYDLEQDLDSLHDHVKSIVFRSPMKLLDQGKAVMEEHNRQLNATVPSKAASQENSEHNVAAEDNPKKRRPGLGLKWPGFSFKPDLRQEKAPVDLEPSFDIDMYEDPDEFFAALERHELAKKEIHKQLGISQEDNVHFNSSQEARPRRPGLLGTRRRSYKHLFSDSDILPQEVLAESTIAPSNSDFQKSVELNIPSEEQDVTGSEKEVDKGNGLLDQLLSKSLEDLEGDGAVNLLQEHLQIKPISIENLCLPEMQNVRMVNMKPTVRNLTKPRLALSDIQNLAKGVVIVSTSDAKHSGTESSSKGYLSSNSRPKSPHAQTAMLKKRLYDPNTSIDPYSSIFVDEVDAQSEDVNMSNNTCISWKVRSPNTKADDSAAAEMGPSDAPHEDSVHMQDDYVRLNMNQEHPHGAGSIHSNDDLADKISGFDMDQSVRDDDVNIADTSSDALAQAASSEEARMPSESDPNMKNLNRKENRKTGDVQGEKQSIDGPSKSEVSAPEQQVEEPTQAPAKRQSKEKIATRKSSKRKAASSDENPEALPNPTITDRVNASGALEELIEEAPREIPNNETKLEQRKWKKHMTNHLSRRQSLAAAGTKWEKCQSEKDQSEKLVRRSTRIRSRPLAYWKGERFLYGRVHESLATVIGVKCFGSPGGDGTPFLKVKSFVDDKYKDLVEFAGLH